MFGAIDSGSRISASSVIQMIYLYYIQFCIR